MPVERRRVPLEESELFAGLEPAQKREVEMAGNRRTLRKGQFLFREGDKSSGLHVLLAGKLKSSRYLAGGQEVVMHFVNSGEVFGELPAFLERPYPASCQAVEESEVFTLPMSALERLLARQPQIGLRIFRSMSKKLSGLLDRLQTQEGLQSDQRIARYLVTSTSKSQARQPVHILPFSKRVWAGEIGIQPESLSRTLRQLTSAGYIQVDGKQITLLDLNALARLASGKK